MKKNIDIRHDLLSYTKDLHPAPVFQNNPCSEAAELRAALVKAQETASEALLKITEMQKKMNKVEEAHNKMSMFVAEFFAEKNNNFLLNQELQALKAEFAKKDKSSQEDKISSQEEMDWSQGD